MFPACTSVRFSCYPLPEWAFSTLSLLIISHLPFFYFFLIFIFTLFYFTILYWFCHTLTWIHHGCTCDPKHEPPSLLPPHNIPLGHPREPPSILSVIKSYRRAFLTSACYMPFIWYLHAIVLILIFYFKHRFFFKEYFPWNWAHWKMTFPLIFVSLMPYIVPDP